MSKRQENLFIDFEKASKSTWHQKATSDLKGEDVYEKYNRSFDDITLEPYYDKTDIQSIQHIHAFQNRFSLKNNPTGENRYWQNLQRIIVSDSQQANAQALEALNNGADGVIFDFTHHQPKHVVKELLKDIQPAYCNVSFIINKDADHVVNEYLQFISEDHIDKDSLNGIFIIEGSPEPSNLFIRYTDLQQISGLKSINIQSTEDSPSGAIADLLFRVMQVIETGKDNTDIKKLFSAISLTMQVSANYFEEIAKIRAMRNLFYQMVQSYGVDGFSPEDLHIHCISPAWIEEKYQPHGNMLKSTTAAMSAILGGCDSLEVQPESYDNPLMTRIARNVSTILKEESYLNATADPVAGSYYIESLTDKLAQKAWAEFQEKLN